MNAQFPGVAGLKSIDRLRRRRNQAEYPDPSSYDPVTSEESEDALTPNRGVDRFGTSRAASGTTWSDVIGADVFVMAGCTDPWIGSAVLSRTGS